MKLAWNAWSLASEPAAPFSLHTLELIETLTGVDEPPSIVLITPESLALGLLSAGQRVVPAAQGPLGRFRFEQRGLSRAAGRIGADLIMCPEPLAPLRAPAPLAVARSKLAAAGSTSIAERLRRAAGLAGASGAALSYRWADESEGGRAREAQRLPPFVSAAFRPTDPGDDRDRRRQLGLPSTYVLCHGAQSVDLELLLAAWTWVEASIGPAVPLVFVGLPAAEVASRARELNVDESVQCVGPVTLADLPALYRGAEAVLHPGHSRTGQEWRWAMACGTPVAGVETERAAAVLGPAAYLVRDGDARALGAACLTLLVERRQLAKDLREKGLLRAGDYHGPQPVEAYWRALRRAARARR